MRGEEEQLPTFLALYPYLTRIPCVSLHAASNILYLKGTNKEAFVMYNPVNVQHKMSLSAALSQSHYETRFKAS